MNLARECQADRLGKFALCIIAILALAYLVVGCSDYRITEPSPNCPPEAQPGGPTGNLVSMSACKNLDLAADGGITAEDQDCIQYAYEGRTLRLKHVNTAFNCCPDVKATILVRGDSIFIIEHEIQGDCRCLCLYDLDYEIRHLEVGSYRVLVSQEYLCEGDEPLEFTMDLLSSPSGTYCVKRDHYPWGD